MRKGFTLIELLVVIAIIAILAAILFPVFAKARSSAMTTKCLVHGQELGKAMMSYMDDHDGRFPSNAKSEMYANISNITWRYRWPAYPASYGDGPYGVNFFNQFAYIQLAKYVRNTDIWICPSPEGMYALKYARRYRNSWMFSIEVWGDKSGLYPDTTFWGTGPEDSGMGKTLMEVLASDLSNFKRYTTPSNKIFAFCVSMGPSIQVEAYKGGPVITPSYSHGEGTLYVYCDGHAKYKDVGCGWAPVGYTKHKWDVPHSRKG